MDDCLTDVQLQEYLEGRLSTAERFRIDKHLRVCRSCADKLTFTQSVRPESPHAQGRALPAVTSAMPRTSSAPVSVGIAVEGYEILHEIARGGMGIVYAAVQLKLNRKVALKVLPSSGADENVVKRFRHEATAAAKLHHTHIVPIYDFGQSGHIYYYAMELVEGWSFNELLRRLAAANAQSADRTRLVEIIHGHAEPSDGDASRADSAFSSSGHDSGSAARGRVYYRHVAEWIADAADALHYAHAQGIIHRDIKPANLMLAVDGRIMILDFGLAKTTGDLSVTATGALLGTLRYMSPEQAMAKRMKVDHRTDIYSLGATLYELLTFQPAFKGTDEKETLGLIITHDPTPPRKILPETPRDLQTICLKTLEKNPDSRYATARDLADDLRRYITGMPIFARPVGPLGRAVKLIRRRKAVSVAVLSGLLLVAASFIAVRATLHSRNTRRAILENTLRDRLKLAAAYSVDGKYQEAESVYEEIIRLDPGHVDAMVSWVGAKRYRFDEDMPRPELDKCDELLNIALALDPRRVSALNARGVIHRLRGRYDAAVDAFTKAIEINPGYYASWVSLAIAHATNRQLIAAEKCLQTAVKLPQTIPDLMPWHNLAAVQHQLRRPEALESIARALEIKPGHPHAMLLKARILLDRQSHEDCLAARRAAFTADELFGASTDPRAARLLALAHLHLEQWNDTIDFARRALRLKDEPAWPHYILAVAEAELGRVNDARADAAVAFKSIPAAFAFNPAQADIETSRHDARGDGVRAAAQVDHIVHIERGLLWFESRDELQRLHTQISRQLPAAP